MLLFLVYSTADLLQQSTKQNPHLWMRLDPKNRISVMSVNVSRQVRDKNSNRKCIKATASQALES